ncbi:hypothetical protein TcasGA2_TC007225 [Tribolium castaneum]|uniref:Uncharacterized protein n=1 Tax=Tribolium castaneum TaxID=7070 RepID=D2A0Q0_TRICA|nr:hypothetical protein TcasGA2_TC007225 [Tribolium castaneum]
MASAPNNYTCISDCSAEAETEDFSRWRLQEASLVAAAEPLCQRDVKSNAADTMPLLYTRESSREHLQINNGKIETWNKLRHSSTSYLVTSCVAERNCFGITSFPLPSQRLFILQPPVLLRKLPSAASQRSQNLHFNSVSN